MAQGSGNGDVRRRPARQGVRDGVGRRQRAGHVRRLPARPQGRAGVRPDLLDRDPQRGRHVDDTGAGLRRRAVRVRLDAHRDRRRPDLRGLRGLHPLRQRPRRLRGRRARPRHRRSDRGPVQGRHPDRRHHRLPDRARPPDLPGLDLPFVVRRQHRGRSHRWRPPRRRMVGHAQQPAPRPGKPVRGGHELRHDRQPVVRRRANVVRRPSRSSCRATSSRAGAPTTPTGCCGSASSTASTTRPTTSTATRWRPRRPRARCPSRPTS